MSVVFVESERRVCGAEGRALGLWVVSAQTRDEAVSAAPAFEDPDGARERESRGKIAFCVVPPRLGIVAGPSTMTPPRGARRPSESEWHSDPFYLPWGLQMNPAKACRGGGVPAASGITAIPMTPREGVTVVILDPKNGMTLLAASAAHDQYKLTHVSSSTLKPSEWRACASCRMHVCMSTLCHF